MPEKRGPGFYWMRRPQESSAPNPFVAYWNGQSWEFVGSLYMLDDDDQALKGFEVLGRANLDA